MNMFSTLMWKDCVVCGLCFAIQLLKFLNSVHNQNNNIIQCMNTIYHYGILKYDNGDAHT